jgi:hypothetical protein
MDVVVGGELPQKLAMTCGQTVEIAIVRPDQDPVTRDYRRRLDLPLGSEGPQRLAVHRLNRVEPPCQVANVDDAVVNQR